MKEAMISEKLVETILEAGKNTFPREFIGLLEEKNEIISELIILPSEQGESLSSIRYDLLPLGLKIAGTIHSHPSNNPFPSAQDKRMFSKIGKIHLICASPFTKKTIKAFDYKGKEIELIIV